MEGGEPRAEALAVGRLDALVEGVVVDELEVVAAITLLGPLAPGQLEPDDLLEVVLAAAAHHACGAGRRHDNGLGRRALFRLRLDGVRVEGVLEVVSV